MDSETKVLLRSVKVQHGENKEDRITGLSEEIIALILSELPFKEATATAILSRRWRYLWTSMSCLNLSFDCGKPLCSNNAYKEQIFHRDVYLYWEKFVGWVNYVLKVLHQHQPTSEVDCFRVCCSLNASYSSHLDGWVKFAFEKRVRELELNLTDFNGKSQHRSYAFPSVAKLYKMVPSIDFTSLTSLHLMNLDASAGVVEHLLFRCVSLEHLCLVRSNTLDNELWISSLKLKKLELYQCETMERFKIIAPNLVSLSYMGPVKEVPFEKENVPLLSEMVLGEDYCESFIFEAPKHSIYFSQLEKLTLIIPLEIVNDVDFFPENLPEMMNLKQLELRVEIYFPCQLERFTVYIKAAPKLTKFVMKLAFGNDIVPDYEYIRDDLRIKTGHENLKEIEIVGFFGHEYDYNLALGLLDCCACLEKLIIDTRHPRNMQGPDVFCEAFAAPDPEVYDFPLNSARNLRSELPQEAELLIL